MFCLTCNAEKHPVQRLSAGSDFLGREGSGFIEACPQCENVFTRLDADAQPAPPPVLAAVAARPSAVPESATGDTIVKQMRARLAVVEAEIAARAKFEVERDRLKRMLAAAGDDDQKAVTAPLAN